MNNNIIEISVIIPNLHSRFIDQTLAALRNQEFDLTRVEVLVIGMDNPGLVFEDKLVRFIPTLKPVGPSIARNLGIAQSRGTILCFTDADCLPDKNWLGTLTKRITDQQSQVIGGGVSFGRYNYWTWCDNMSWFSEFSIWTSPGIRDMLPSLNLAVHRSVIDHVGVFDEAFPHASGEDADWTLRMRAAGYTLHFFPEAKVMHCPERSSLSDLWHHGWVYGRFSSKVLPRNEEQVNVPLVLRNPALLLITSPLLALAACSRTITRYKHLDRAWLCFPGVYLSKLAWCFGALRATMDRS